MDKAAYVTRQRQTRSHGCHWTGCTRQCPPAMWGCKEHWFKLPKPLRDAVWRAYVPGQEVTGTPSVKYLAVAQIVQEWIAGRIRVNQDGSIDTLETTEDFSRRVAEKISGSTDDTAKGA